MESKRRELLTTEYLDLTYLYTFDSGNSLDMLSDVDYIYDTLNKFTKASLVKYVKMTNAKDVKRKGWNVVGDVGTWAKPVYKAPKGLPYDTLHYMMHRLYTDMSILSEEYLERGEIARVFIAPLRIHIRPSKELPKELCELKGHLGIFLHKNGVLILTLWLPIYNVKLSSTQVLLLRYLLEVEGVTFEVSETPYRIWLSLKRGSKPTLEFTVKTVNVKVKVTELLEMYASFIKYVLLSRMDYEIKDLTELGNLTRIPWDDMYTILFTEILRGERRFIELLREYSIQMYAMLYGSRRLASESVVKEVISKSFRYIPTLRVKGATKEQLYRVRRARVTILIRESDTHIASISRTYIGTSDVGKRLRWVHITVLELINHVRHSLKMFDYLFTYTRPKNLEDLANIRSEFSKTIDYVDHAYFIVDRDMRELFKYCSNALDLRRLINSVQRKFESLSYVIMTRYQERLGKMQVLLSILFGIFAIPFFLFSYFQWFFDYALEGKSERVLEVTVFTFLPIIPILLLILYFYYKWRREVFK